jgi:peptidoglycan/LPS O-acetylase OafA/YrhL
MARYSFLDATRGIAACSVMLQHSLYASGILGDFNSGRPLTGFIPTWLEFGETGVVAFFLVSGFVIPLSLEKTANLRLFWIHRAFRIYPLYIAVYIIFFAITGGKNIHSIWIFTTNALSHIFFLQEYLKQENFVPGAWTLSLEMVWYIAVSFAFVLSLSRRTNLLVAFGVLLSLAAQIVCALGHHFPMGRVSLLVCCLLGLVSYRYAFRLISARHFTCLAGVLIATIVTNLFVGFYLFPGLHPSATFRMAFDSWVLAGSIFFVPFFTRNAAIWEHSFLTHLGRISYSTYLLHGVVLYLLVRISLSGFVLIGATFVLTFFVSTLSYRFIEAPWIRFGHAVKFRVVPVSAANTG